MSREFADRPPEDPAVLDVTEVDNPCPGRSLGDIGVVVRVELVPGPRSTRGALVRIAYAEDDLGWVDRTTLRLFEIDPESETYTLVERSWADPDDGAVLALVRTSGLYALLGLPGPGPVRDTVDELRRTGLLDPPHEPAWHHPICRFILCAADESLGDLPGGLARGGFAHGSPALARFVPGDVCSSCLGLQPGPLIDPIIELVLEPLTPPPPVAHARIYALACYSVAGPPIDHRNAHIEVVESGAWTKVDEVTLPDYPAAIDLAVSATNIAVVSLLSTDAQVIDIDPPHAVKAIPMGMIGAGCRLSPDGSTLWASGDAGLKRFDVANAAETYFLPFAGGCQSTCMSPDGDAVATVGKLNGTIATVRTGTLQVQQITLPGLGGTLPWAVGLTFESDTALVAWALTSTQRTLFHVKLAGPTVDAQVNVTGTPAGFNTDYARVAALPGVAYSAENTRIGATDYHGIVSASAATGGFKTKAVPEWHLSPIIDSRNPDAVIFAAEDGLSGKVWLARYDATTLAQVPPFNTELFAGVPGRRENEAWVTLAVRG